MFVDECEGCGELCGLLYESKNPKYHQMCRECNQKIEHSILTPNEVENLLNEIVEPLEKTICATCTGYCGKNAKLKCDLIQKHLNSIGYAVHNSNIIRNEV